ncbi:MAG: aminotransferase class I/II-fold pyridoxal phosphate-dependent enzyme, partial [Bacteroidota bacterium]
MSDQIFETIDQVIRQGQQHDVLHNFVDSLSPEGRFATVDGRKLLNFGSCSYLGLEYLPELKQAAIDAVQTYGTQFSSSRMYASLGLYRELESQLRQMYERPVMVTASTTLGHLATIPVIVESGDAVILDMQVHSSVQMATELLKARGITIAVIRHNDMDHLESKLRALKEKHGKVWYFADGVYSMYGDFAPVHHLVDLMDRYPQFHLYIDDAHGMSWAGKNGIGYVRSQIKHHPKMVLAVSLNKAFAASGGAIVFPTAEMETAARNCGGTMIFSGPIQPPMLGVACASAAWHQSTAITARQERLQQLIRYTNQRLNALGLPQFMETESPLYFIPAGLPAVSINIIRRMLDEGFYVNAAGFPATPMKRGGVRFMLNANLTEADIDAMLEALAYHYPRGLEETGSSCAAVAKAFRIPEFEVKGMRELEIAAEAPSKGLTVSRATSIEEMDQNAWDRLVVGKGNFTASALALIEGVFVEAPEPQHQWDFEYFQ